VEQADVIAIAEQGGQFCVEVFFFRNWQNWGNRAYFPKADKSLTTEEVLTSFIVQFYSDKPRPPKQVLLSQDIGEAALVATALCVRAGHKVEVLAPSAGSGGRSSRCAAQRQGGARAASGGHRLAAAPARSPRRRLLAGAQPAPRRGLRQLAHHGHERGRRDDRRGRGRLHEDALPHLQHARRQDHPRRRFRHDARDAAPPLRPAAQGNPRGAQADAPTDDPAGRTIPPTNSPPGPISSSSTAARGR
jgi:hypothetical protein